jgi:two-component system, chemotaxis family, sensor kinase CheA
MKKETVSELRSLTEKIATELVFAEPGKDLGLLPVNSLLSQIEELITAAAAPEAVLRGARQARQCVDAAFESTGTFSAPVLKRLGEWVVWWQEVLGADERQSAPPPPPAEWNKPEEKTPAAAPASTPSSAAAASPESAEEPVVNLNLDEDRELLVEFINESEEHLQNVEQGVLVLEENPSDAETLNSIFRAFHTFK